MKPGNDQCCPAPLGIIVKRPITAECFFTTIGSRLYPKNPGDVQTKRVIFHVGSTTMPCTKTLLTNPYSTSTCGSQLAIFKSVLSSSPISSKRSFPQIMGRQSLLVIIVAVALRLVLFAAFPSLPNLLTNRVEISTPVTSFKRLQEGLFLYTHGVSPYDGGVFHQVFLLPPFPSPPLTNEPRLPYSSPSSPLSRPPP